MLADNARVLVLGARGRLGAVVSQAFASAGWQVVAQARTGANLQPQQAGITWVQASAQDDTTLRAAAQGCSIVVHAMNPGAYTTRAWQQEAPGLMQAAIALSQALDATLLFPGNVYPYGAYMPAALTPDTPQRPSSAKSQIRAALEQQLRHACQTQGLRAVLIRAGDFYGAGTGSWLDLVIAKKLGRGHITWPTTRNIAHAWAYLPDLAQTFVRVAQSLQQAPAQGLEVLHFAGHSVSRQDWQDALAQIAHERGWLAPDQALQVRTLPWALMRLAAWLNPTLASLVEMRYLWDTPHALDGTALAQRVGSVPATPFVSAVRSALAQLPPTALGLPAHEGPLRMSTPLGD